MSPRRADICVVFLVIVVVSAVAGCTGDLTTATQAQTLVGQGVLPPSAGGAPAANSRVLVLDLEKSGAVVAEVTTDASGRYGVVTGIASSAAIVIFAQVGGREVLVSGLVAPASTGTSKDFSGATTIACEAGVAAVLDRTITAAQLNAARIRNLELAAQRFVDTVNFFDLTGSVRPAAEQVRILTNDGAHPPA
ncbi:MAG: hypothetical protein ACRELA_10345 [Candidatus Rokuibacteriota bacterium]